jgi:hypothetical protein
MTCYSTSNRFASRTSSLKFNLDEAIRSAGIGDFLTDLPKSSADASKKKLSDKKFDVKLADGTSWKLEYKSNGYYSVNTSTGFSNAGTWQAADGQLCLQPRGASYAPRCTGASGWHCYETPER